ncbi:MAG TPA: transcription elongation factor GreA [Terriglobales bacterium]|nr:transcription elongation factor GreA [Candidatus Acidoferrum sp.]HWQ51510.1 transcription elongation factor GreA [Terriglobales bacterium]
MAATNEFVMTKREYDALQKRQEYLVTERRQEVANNLKQARGFGDLSENAEYDDAKNEQAILEAEIAQNEAKLTGARIVDESEIDEDKVHIGSVVVVYDKEFNEESTYTLVGAADNDPLSNKISRESPIGAALLGHEAGDTIAVETPGGTVVLEIRSIAFDPDAHQ